MVFAVDPGAPGRNLVVHAASVRVVVTGTRFAVGHLGEQVQVSVERGSVRVEWLGGTANLTARQSWMGPPRPDVSLPTPSEATPVRGTADQEGRPSRRSTPPPEQVVPSGPEAARGWAQILDAREAGAPSSEVRARVAAFLQAHPGWPLLAEAELLDLELQSLDGDPHAAAALLEHWLRTHGGDPRASRVHLWLATLAAVRLGDCERAQASFGVLARGPYADAVAPYVAECAR